MLAVLSVAHLLTLHAFGHLKQFSTELNKLRSPVYNLCYTATLEDYITPNTPFLFVHLSMARDAHEERVTRLI